MDAHTLPCDRCGARFDDDDLEYIEGGNYYLCYRCVIEELEEDNLNEEDDYL